MAKTTPLNIDSSVPELRAASRPVRLNLTHSYAQGQTVALAISSPSPGDGKSMVSSNLALSFAEAGYRVVLVDGDIRRGDLHRTFSVDRRPGLLDYLTGEVDISAILRPTSHPRLMLVSCGTRHSHGPELLGSSRMQVLVTLLRSRFDVVLFDTPPLGAGIDPFVLATATGNLALVMRAGETDRQLAEAKMQVLDRLPVRMLGAILNDVRVTFVGIPATLAASYEDGVHLERRGDILAVAAEITWSSDRIGEAQLEIDLARLVGPILRETRTQLAWVAIGVTAFGVVAGLGFVALLVGPLRRLRAGVERLAAGDLAVRVPPTSRDEVGELTAAFNEMGESLQQKARIQQAFGRYASDYVLQTLLESPEGSDLQGVQRDVTVLFADIRGFTRMSEGLKARDVVSLLNEIFQLDSDAILKRGGTLDKFIGDSVS